MNIYEMDKKQRLSLLFKDCHRIGNLADKVTATERLKYIMGVFTRQILGAYTLWSICNPKPRPELFEINETGIHDFPSGYVVARSMYEAVLLSNFILLSREFENCRNIVVKVASLHSLRERKLLGANMNANSQEFKEVMNQIPGLENEIKSHNEFQYLPLNTRKFVEDPNQEKWHYKKMPDLAMLAGFHLTWHIQYYGFLSNYAHANPLSIEQVEAVRSPEEAESMSEMIYDLAENFLSRTMDIYVRACNSIDIKIKPSAESLEMIDSWLTLNSRDMRIRP